jgi:branched-chain amino acid aminotransferase
MLRNREDDRYTETVIHRFLLHNHEIREATEPLLRPGQLGLLAGWGIFSTIRVRDGVLFAFERHWARMKRDAELMRVPFPVHAEEMEAQLVRLVESNSVENGTLRVVVVRNRGGLWEGPAETRDYDLIALTADLHGWGDSVALGLVRNGRHAASPFAGTKILSWAQNLTWYEEAHARGLDEVVLLNEREEVAECTSANIFAAHGDRVSTPPLSSGCLPGITRAVLLGEVHIPGFTVEERVLRTADLEAADQVFITSTTRELLPVRSVEGLRIRNSSAACEALQKAFTAFADAYVRNARKSRLTTAR